MLRRNEAFGSISRTATLGCPVLWAAAFSTTLSTKGQVGISAYGGPPRVAVLLKLRDFGEMEIVHFHGGDDHFERFFPGCAHGWAHHLDVRKHFEDALVETEISKAAGDPAVLNQERTVARHSGEDFFVGVYIADVPEPRDQDASVGGTDHFVHR